MPTGHMPTGGNRSGPAPKPRALRVLHGDPTAKTSQEPVPADKPVRVPDFLTEPGRKLWDELTPDMIRIGLLTAWDAPIFGEFCEALVILRVSRIQAMREAAGQVTPASGQASAINGWLRAMTVVTTLSQRFGMTPADRTRLIADSMAGISAAPTGMSDLLSG
jgi:phage terminase small subunit